MGKIVGRFREARLDYQLKHLRESGKSITMEYIAAAIGVTRQSLSDIETGRVLPRSKTLAAICKLYGVQPGDLLRYEE